MSSKMNIFFIRLLGCFTSITRSPHEFHGTLSVMDTMSSLQLLTENEPRDADEGIATGARNEQL